MGLSASQGKSTTVVMVMPMVVFCILGSGLTGEEEERCGARVRGPKTLKTSHFQSFSEFFHTDRSRNNCDATFMQCDRF